MSVTRKRQFIRAEDGAVTIDWVALAAGLLILGVGIVGLLTDELQSVTDEIETQLASATAVDTLIDGEGGGSESTSYATSVEGVFAKAGDLYTELDGTPGPTKGDRFYIDNGDGSTSYVQNGAHVVESGSEEMNTFAIAKASAQNGTSSMGFEVIE